MKTFFTILSLCLSFSLISAQEHFIKHGSYNRAYLLYVPSVYDGSAAYPLIIVLHGAGGTDSSLYNSGFNERSEIMKYIVVYPEGLNRNWSGPDNDMDFISVLIDTLKAKFNIDTNRVYAMGQSAGAFFSHRLAAGLSNKIAAIAPLAGANGGTAPISPKPVCAVHAVDDNLVSYSSNLASLAVWRRVNGCSDIPDTIYNSNGVIGQLWKADETGADVVLYTYSSGGHSWLNSPVNCADFIVDFLYTHPERNTKVTITSPINTQFNAPGNIDLTASVESDISVIKVEYFANLTKIGESSSAPYLVKWKDIPQNVYLIYARALLADGTSEISSNVRQIQFMLPNVALNKPFACSASESNLYQPQNAFDGNFTTRWSTPFSDPQWISVDLQKNYLIQGVTLFWETACALEYRIDVSSENQNWTSVYSTSSGKGGTEFISFPTVEARYIRMYGTRRATSYGYSLWEFQVHGNEVTSVTSLTDSKLILDITCSPNPFNSETTIHYTIAKEGYVELEVYNIAGEKIRTLIKTHKKAGEYTVRWNSNYDSGYPASSGVYICCLCTSEGVVSRKLLLLK